MHPLVDVVRLIGRKIQTDNMIKLIENSSNESNLRVKNFYDLFFYSRNENDKYINESIHKINRIIEIDLSKDLLISYPWKKSRLITNISLIGEKRVGGKWKQDDINHKVILILPMGISFVYGGNHSIVSGIIQGEGKIRVEKIYDISNVYNFVYYDGKNYIRKRDNSIISKVDNIVIAAIFEIGGLMKEHSISY